MGVVLHADVRARVDAYAAFLRIERRRGAKTVLRYRGIVEEFAVHVAARTGADVDFSTLTKHHCLSFLRSVGGQPATEESLSRSVWNLRLAALRSFFQYFVHEEVIVQNPTHGIERHKIASREPVPLSLDEFLALIDAADRTTLELRARNVAIVQTLFHTALRVAELVSLDVDQVDWDARVLRDVRTKGEKWLSAPFNDMAAESLERHLAERIRQRQVSEGALFLSMRGTRLSVRAVQKLVSQLGEAAKIGRPVTPHLFRHSNATELVELGTPLKVVQEICGHASQVTTERYVHARAGAHRTAIDALGAKVARRMRSRRAPAVVALPTPPRFA